MREPVAAEPGIVIVTHNSGAVIGRSLDSCAGLDTIVVDNASTDSTVQHVQSRLMRSERMQSSQRVRLIANGSNRGFATAVNQGVTALDREFILLLNPDAEIETPVHGLVEACGAPGVGIVAGRLVDSAGKSQAGFNIRRLPSAWTLVFEVLGLNRIWAGNPVNRRYRWLDFDFEHAAAIEQPAGAFLLFRRAFWRELGGFDEEFYPLWFEDVDFCQRALAAGSRIQYVPEVRARHAGAHSISQLQWSCRELYWYASLLRYASKHFRLRAFRGISAAVVLGSLLRAVSGAVIRGNLKPVAVYGRVVRLAAMSFLAGRVSKMREIADSTQEHNSPHAL